MAKRMTAAERKAEEAQAKSRALFSALAWPAEPNPQPYTQERIADLTAGLGYEPHDVVPAWTYLEGRREVMLGCFDHFGHSKRDSTKTTTLTPGGPWFATEAEARLAMRWAVCQAMAAELLALVEAEAKVVVRDISRQETADASGK